MSDAEMFLETGARIRELRGDISQAEFAERLGVDRKTVVRWEAGERLPDGKSLLALMQVFAASASYLLTGEERGAKSANAAEQVLIDSYRRCNAEAKRNLIQTAALLSAGMGEAVDATSQTAPRGRKAMNGPLRKLPSEPDHSGDQSAIGDDNIQVGLGAVVSRSIMGLAIGGRGKRKD